MKYKDLRDKVRNHPKYEGCVNVERAPLITPGFPGTFNLSFTEHDWLKEYGRYTDFDHNFIFSTTQSCIRPDDFLELSNQNSWKYLGVFEIGDLTGIINLQKKPDYRVLQLRQVRDLVNFLGNLGIALDRIHPSYCSGGSVRDLTEGKYNLGIEIPQDNISKQAFLEAGVPEENLIPDKSRDTLLSLHLHRPTSWAYRNEVNVNIGTKEKPVLLDVGTLEYFMWKPLFFGETDKSKNIVTLTESKDGVSLCAFGLERLSMAQDGLLRVQDVDYLIPFYKQLGSNLLVGESLRALHRIYSDITTMNVKPGRHQGQKIRKFIQNVPCGINGSYLRDLLTIHSETQPWHDNLKEGIESTIERIGQYRKAV